MAQPDSISTLRRRRSGLANRFTITKRQLDEYEESGQVNNGYLVSCRNSFDEYWRKLSAVQDELEELDQGEIACRASLLQEHLKINTRLIDLFDQIPATTPSTTKTRDSCVNPEPTPITLPEVSLPQFDGAFENWTYSYDTFSSTVDRNEHLTEVQKVQHESTHQVEAVQLEIELLDSNGQSRDLEIREQYEDIYERLRRNQRVARQPRSSRPAHNGSTAGIKLLRNALNQPTSRDSLDRTKLNPVQDDNGRTPPTESNASTPAPIPSHSTRSSPRDIRNISTTRDLTTTTFAASASQSSDSTLHNVLNQPITQDPPDRKELILFQDDNGRTPPTEGTASTQTAIPSHTTLSLPRDTHNVSPTRDLTTTTFPSSASQLSDSTTQNISNRPNAPDLQDRKELNHVQDKNVYTPPTENITLHVTPDMDIISESLSPQPNAKNPPSPRRRGATPASNPNRDNLHVITTMTNHLIVSSFQNAPADFNTCPLSPQSTTSDKSLILSFADCWTMSVQLPAISEKAQSEGVIGGSSVPQSNTKLCDVFESVPCIIGVSFNDTSWAEVFHNTSWAKLFHDASWIVNFIAPSARRRTRIQDRRIPSAHRPFGRIIKFLLATTTSSGRPQSTRQQQPTRRRIEDLINSTSTEF